MLKFGNKEFRNLQEQVLKNMRDIENLVASGMILDEFGIKVVGQESSVANMPTVAQYKEAHEDWAYGDAYAIGTEEPYTLYILTRANETHTEDYWFDIGEFPAVGPEGPQGPQGETGPQGPQGNPGSNGAAAGFGVVSASATTLTPGSDATVSVVASGPDTEKSFAFTFGIPEGQPGQDGASEWGDITGDIADQTDLITVLQGKQNVIDSSHKLPASNISGLSTVATSGDYADLSNKPSIPTVSGTNDGTNWTSITIDSDTYAIPQGGGSGTVTDVKVNGSSVVNENGVALVTVPTNNNQLTNGAGYITSSALTGYAKLNGGASEIYPQYFEGYNEFTHRLRSKEGFNASSSEDWSYPARDTIYGQKYIYMAGGTNGYTLEFPIKDGTIAVTSDLNGYATESYVQGYHDSTKQDVISDLATIRSGAALGATAVQPAAISDMATETWVGQQGYLTSVSWSDVSGKPTFATVATSGSYNDLSDKPTIPVVSYPVTDVEVNGSSVLSGTVAQITVPTNYVTTNTDQGINGKKTFGGNVVFESDVNFEALPIINYDSSDPNTSPGAILFDDANTYDMSLEVGALTATRHITLPDKTGTIALTSDIPSLTNYVTTDTTQTVTGAKTFNNHTVFSYSGLDDPIESQYTSGAGFLKFSLSGGQSNYGHLTAGALTDSRTYTFPDKSGTIAMTSDIPSSANFVTTNTTQVIESANKEFRNSNIYLTGNNYGQSALYFNNSIILKPDTNNKLLVQSSNLDVTGDTYGVLFPDTHSYTSNKTLATTDDIPSLTNYVTTNTTQSISGNKTFTGSVEIDTLEVEQLSFSGASVHAEVFNNEFEIVAENDEPISIYSGGAFTYNGDQIATLNDIPTVPVTDVTVNGTSVVSSGTAAVSVPTSASTTVSASSETFTFEYTDGTTTTKTFLTAITSATTTLS